MLFFCCLLLLWAGCDENNGSRIKKIIGHHQCIEECVKNRLLSECMTDEKKSREFFLPPLFPTFECTPSYSSTIVHITRSLLNSPPHPQHSGNPRQPYIPYMHQLCLLHVSYKLSTFLKGCPHFYIKHRTPTVITLAMGFVVRFMVRTPQHLVHIWSCLISGSVGLTFYTINRLRFSPHLLPWQSQMTHE